MLLRRIQRDLTVLADALQHLIRGIVATPTMSRSRTRTFVAGGCSRCG